MSLDPANAKTEAGRAYPLAWTIDVGEGRVFYSALGHRDDVWRDQRYVEHVLAGIKWAAKREASK
jgi:type 1 glutamine amidotransferase